MKSVFLNDEETAIMESINGCTQQEKIQILRHSIAEATDETSRRTLRSLLLKLRGGVSPT